MMHILKLFIVGNTPNSITTIKNLKKIAKRLPDNQYTIEIIDVIKNPKLAYDEKIIAVPALIKNLPPPMRTVIGNLSNTEDVLLGLDIKIIDIKVYEVL